MVVHFLSQGQEIQKDNSDKNITFFNKNELSSILSFYGKKVSQGLLKDYAIDHLKTHAIFSFYRNTFESAYLQIYKNKKITKSRSKYILINSAGFSQEELEKKYWRDHYQINKIKKTY